VSPSNYLGLMQIRPPQSPRL